MLTPEDPPRLWEDDQTLLDFQERALRGFPGKLALASHSFLSVSGMAEEFCVCSQSIVQTDTFRPLVCQSTAGSEGCLHSTPLRKSLASQGPYFPHLKNGVIDSYPT